MPAYGAIEPSAAPSARRPTEGGTQHRRPVLALAALAMLCVASTAWLGGGSQAVVELVSMGSLGQDERDMDGVESDIQTELNKNSLLSQKFSHTFGGGSDMPKAASTQGESTNCKCDCSTQPQLAGKAREMMLEQVGENVFFGKCASCPCLQGFSIEAEVARLSKALAAVTQGEDVLHKKEQANIPVDVVFRVGEKGTPGKVGPVGFQGPDGPVGATGEKGPTGPVGSKGFKGPTGPKGYKGNDGERGQPGLDGERGDQGPPGPRGDEGPAGGRGGQGANGDNGKNGPQGHKGIDGPRGEAAPPFGLKGPPGSPGPPGPTGGKGGQGVEGDKGYTGNPGPDGANGLAGVMGERGPTGKGCDGVETPSGESPKVIDACGVCGGDESECAKTKSARTAYAVGDPHYRTFDGKSFDYQIAGEYILARHMNDVELQNKQVYCPNSAVRCNIGCAVITKNINIQFRSEWKNDNIMVNGDLWTRGNQYKDCRWQTLDLNTRFHVCGASYTVAFNDLKVGAGALIYGSMHGWGAPLPNGLYHQIYFDAPGRWSSGLSMTGLFANFDNDPGDDWDAIAPSTLWWVAGTSSSAFSNPKYLLNWDNRITKAPGQGVGGGAGSPDFRNKAMNVVSLAAMEQHGDKAGSTKINWSAKDEHKYLVEVDEVTAKMRRRLFAKMAADGSIERKRGVPKPTTGLAAVELDVEPYAGMRPDHLRVEQQMLLRQEWKHLSKSQRKSMLAGSVTSGNAVGAEVMCHECLKGEATCTPKGITYEDQKHKDLCHDVCLKWLKPEDTSAICKCWIDCGAGGMQNQQLSNDAVDNYLSPRTLSLVPADGDSAKRCIPLDSAGVKEFKAIKYRQVLWKPEQGTNFLLSFWWQPNAAKFVDKDHANQPIKSLRSLVYKGTYPYSSVTPLHIEADLTSGSPPYIKVTVGGKSFRSANRLHATEFSFIAVTKEDNLVRLYVGAGVSIPPPISPPSN